MATFTAATPLTGTTIQAACTNAANAFGSTGVVSTVQIPGNQSCTISTPINITTPMIVIGGFNGGVTTIHNSTTGGGTAIFGVVSSQDQRIEIGNMTLIGDVQGGFGNAGSSGIILSNSGTLLNNIVIHDIIFQNFHYGIQNGSNGDCAGFGVVYNCTFTKCFDSIRFGGFRLTSMLGGTTVPSPAWGTAFYFVIEDSIFTTPSGGPYLYEGDSDGPANYMVRHCTMSITGGDESGFDMHGNNKNGGINSFLNPFGCVIHDNTWTMTSASMDKLTDVRGGVGSLIYNNTVNGAGTNNALRNNANSTGDSVSPTQTYYLNNKANGASIDPPGIVDAGIILGTNYFSGTLPAGFTQVSGGESYQGNTLAYPHPLRAAASPDTTPPTIPSGFSIAVISAHQINLAWTQSTDTNNAGTAQPQSGITYLIFRALGPTTGTFSQIATTAGGASSYSDLTLAASTQYSYKIQAQDAASPPNVSGFSSALSATTQSAGTSPAFVQICENDLGAPANTVVTATFQLAQTAGDCNLVAVAWHPGAVSASVTDTALNVYTAAGPVVVSSDGVRAQQIFSAKNIVAFAANSNVVTATVNSSSTNLTIRALEYFGISVTTPIDAIASSTNVGSTASAGPVVPTQSGDILVGFTYAGATVATISSGYTQRNTGFSLAEDQTVGSPTGSSLTPTVANNLQATVQQAVNNASPGDTIVLQPSTTPAGDNWATSVDINKSITIIAPNPVFNPSNPKVPNANYTRINSTSPGTITPSPTSSPPASGLGSMSDYAFASSTSTSITDGTGVTGTTESQIGEPPTIYDTNLFRIWSQTTDIAVRISGIYCDMQNIPLYSHTGGYQGPDKSAIGIFGLSRFDSGHAPPEFGSVDGLGGLDALHVLTQIRIDHCYFNSGKSQIHAFGHVEGCVDHCTFLNGDIGLSVWGYSSDAWIPSSIGTPAVNTPGTSHALFCEDSFFCVDNNVTWTTATSSNGRTNWAIDHQVYHALGARSVIRNNTFDLTAMTLSSTSIQDPTNYLVDVHGNQVYYRSGGHFNFRGNPLIEIYNNSFAVHGTYQWAELRGGSILFYGNSLTTSNGSSAAIELWEEEAWQTSFFPSNALRTTANTATPWPGEDQINATFIYSNTKDSVLATVANGGILRGNPRVADGGAAERVLIQENRDFWQSQPSPSTTTSYPPVTELGTGVGYPNVYSPITSYTAFTYPHPFNVTTSTTGFSASVGLSSSVGWIMHLVALKTVPLFLPPTVPTGFSATANGSTAMTITWTTSTDTAPGQKQDANNLLVYPIEHKGGSIANFTEFTTGTGAPGVTSGQATYPDSGLTPSTVYTYQMRSRDTAGITSAYTTTFTGQTGAADTNPPTAPSALVATAVSTSQINLTWSPSSDLTNPESTLTYLIERAPASLVFVQIATSGPGSNHTYSDLGLTPNTTYNYRIRAQDPSANQSPYFPSSAPFPNAQTFPIATSIALVQHGTGLNTVTGTTMTLPFNAAQGVGDGNIVSIAYPSSVTATVKDSINGPYALAKTVTDATQAYTIGVYYRVNIAVATAGSNTVTATFSASVNAGAATIHISEFTSLATYNPVDVTVSTTAAGSASGTSEVVSSGSATTLHASDLLYGAGLPANNFTAAGSTYTLLDINVPDGTISEYKLVNSVGSYFADATIAGGGAYTMVMVAFKSTAATQAAYSYPIKVSPNNRYLIDQSNVPFLMFSDTVWPLVTNLSLSDANIYFANRASHGFNTIFFSLFAGIEVGGLGNMATIEGTLPFTGAGGTTFTGTTALNGNTLSNTYNLANPNPVYFTKVNTLIAMAAAYGMTVMLNPIENYGWANPNYPNSPNVGPYPFVASSSAVLTTFGQFLGTTFKGNKNLIWAHGNDYQNEPAFDTNLLLIVNGIKATDTTTPHIHTLELKYTTSLSTDDANWISAINLNEVYTYYPAYAQSYLGYNFAPTKPVFVGETVYEGFTTNPGIDPGTVQVYRRQVCWTLTSGLTGWQSGSMVWDLTTSPNWKTFLDSPGVSQVAFMLNVLQANNWQNLVPDLSNTFITAGKGTKFTTLTGSPVGTIPADTFATAALTPDGTFGICYAPVATTLTVNMASMAGPVTAQWMDPSNGVQTAAGVGTQPFANTGTRTFTSPTVTSDGLHDFVLILTATASVPPQTINTTAITTGEFFGTLRADSTRDVTLMAISTAELFGHPTVTPISATVLLTAIVSGEAFGTLNVAPGPETITATAIPTAEFFGALKVDRPTTVTFPAILTAEFFGTMSVDRVTIVFLQGIPSAEQFNVGNMVVLRGGDQLVTLAGIPTAETFGTLVVSPVSVTVSLTAIPTAEFFGSLLVVTPTGIEVFLAAIGSGESFGYPVVTYAGGQIIYQARIPTAENFGTLAVNPSGAAVITATAIPSQERIGDMQIFGPNGYIFANPIPSAEFFGTLQVSTSLTPTHMSRIL